MDYQNRPQRQMHDVSALGLKCEECGAEIKELPFEPTKRDDGTYGRLYCQPCNRNRRKSFGGGDRGGFGGGRRDRY
ncbi:MAG: hypothetical protein COS72_03745 [Candidatus Moranbacteria bacterium CG06_land_8_20_14_3_00_43_56]|nr:MAG: hypothetical protein COS72_03745 [Candidatus Moranbacteria bacterium CG06_land_8_20_14_3_00_43_56]PIW93392.1 MAG: hypothetical protein COZ87_01705 [Candidatus Moranbacteria bacterium CG_4_8_14_3_um_filter_43_15]PJA86347.1 MAG: hypothetical protein CO142_00620 [Candidatus Moranbacteria bacterium CG_4_9_14_3_um_filter_44_28]